MSAIWDLLIDKLILLDRLNYERNTKKVVGKSKERSQSFEY